MYKAEYAVPFWLSFAVFAAAVWAAVRWATKPRRQKKKNVVSVTRDTGKHLMYFSLILLFSVWALRFSVGMWCCSHPDPLDEIRQMDGWSQFFNSLLHALQTFSMDEDYTAYYTNGLELASEMCFGHFRMFWVLYLSVMNVAAPLAGGAFIFEILAGIFPQIRYTASRVCWWKNRYFLTALNEQSVALAKSIASGGEKHVQIVFTDAYTDDEDEESTELLLSAKALGAICLKDDLLHIDLSRSPRWLARRLASRGKTRVFLSDRKENVNLQTLAQLLDPENDVSGEQMEIYVFGSENRITYVEDAVTYLCNRMRAEHGDKLKKHSVFPVNGVRNMAQNLFYELPLFESLYGREKRDREINLTLIGSGTIGTELFLNALWFGQMADVKLNVNVVSKKESEESFVSRINAVCPEIMRSARAGDELLNAAADGRNDQPPYFGFRYKQADVLTDQLDSMMKNGIGEDAFPLRRTDYFIVAAGSDEDNLRIADRLRETVGYYHLHEAHDKKTIISYVIYNSSLCTALNCRSRLRTVASAAEKQALGAPAGEKKPEKNAAEKKEFDIYMHAFGGLEEIYSRKNIFFDRVREIGERLGRSFIESEHKPRTYSFYNDRANRARALHVIYKAFCVGAVSPKLFCSESDEAYRQAMEDAERAYPERVGDLEKLEELEGQSPETGITPHASLHDLAWTEHRRWNAFMRINGFRCPGDYADYQALDSDVHIQGTDTDYQFLFLKLHPCITESARERFRVPLKIRQADRKEVKKLMDYPNMAAYDKLDALSRALEQPFKMYDYPEREIPKATGEGK